MFTEKSSAILSPIYRLGNEHTNELYVKREDLIPFSFGGNKARKAILFFDDLEKNNHDCVVTYGSSSSNHCRVIGNLAAHKGMAIYIISPQEASEPTYNSKMIELFGAEVTIVPTDMVARTIDKLMTRLQQEGKNPYFIPGGGHGNIGTQAFVDCYREILQYEKDNNIYFDYIFHASGTGTTQAGLVCGQLMNGDSRNIVGISVARRLPQGREVILDSVATYLQAKDIHIEQIQIDKTTIFDDRYIGAGYGDMNSGRVIDYVLKKYGIPLDGTYTGKAFMGMLSYLELLSHKKVLFIHTGGTPLFFDYLKNEAER